MQHPPLLPPLPGVSFGWHAADWSILVQILLCHGMVCLSGRFSLTAIYLKKKNISDFLFNYHKSVKTIRCNNKYKLIVCC